MGATNDQINEAILVDHMSAKLAKKKITNITENIFYCP
jgi:hypothetical protein